MRNLQCDAAGVDQRVQVYVMPMYNQLARAKAALPPPTLHSFSSGPGASAPQPIPYNSRPEVIEGYGVATMAAFRAAGDAQSGTYTSPRMQEHGNGGGGGMPSPQGRQAQV